jgi:hypothetical protein
MRIINKSARSIYQAFDILCLKRLLEIEAN